MVRLFPCPFCSSGHVVQVGGGRRFQHYQCAACAEVWTAQGPLVPIVADDQRPPAEAVDGGRHRKRAWPPKLPRD